MSRGIPNLALGEFTHGENKNLGIYNFYVTKNPVHKLLRYFPLRQNSYMISICTEGNLRVRLNGEEICILPNTITIFTPTTIIDMIEISEDYRCHLVVFMKSFLIETPGDLYIIERFRFLNSSGLFDLKTENGDVSVLLSYINAVIEKQNDKSHAFRKDVIRSLIIALLYEIENILRPFFTEQDLGKNFRKEQIIADFQELLQKNFSTERKVAFYAQQLKISTPSLTKIVQEYTGNSAKEQIDEMVLMNAKVLLQSRKFNVSEIASMLNYNNLEEFSRFFKKKTGIAPLNFSKLK
jgi:AraC-like DNA-binding protein